MSALKHIQNDNHQKLLRHLYDALETSFGPLCWWPAVAGKTSPEIDRATPFEVCVGAILTQNAPWTGVVKAIKALEEFGLFSVEGILSVDEKVLAEAVRPTVYYNQ